MPQPVSGTEAAEPRPRKSDPFQASLGILLSIAKEEAGAIGFALYQCDVNDQTLILRCGQGLPDRKSGRLPFAATRLLDRPQAPAGEGTLEIVSLPIPSRDGLAGVVEFGFSEQGGVSAAQREVLQFTAAAVGTLLEREQTTTKLIEVTARIVELEAQLADLKISERARGLARLGRRLRRSEILRAHVARVLESLELETVLTEHLKTLEQKIEERRVVAQAKALLQRTQELTEEEAYRRLREASRRARTKLIAIANDVLAGRVQLAADRS